MTNAPTRNQMQQLMLQALRATHQIPFNDVPSILPNAKGVCVSVMLGSRLCDLEF